MTIETTKIEFFNQIAKKWDRRKNLPELHDNLITGLWKFGISPDETVLDVGCGTGNLSFALLSILGNNGRVVAIDISPAMLEEAKRKIQDPRMTWHLSSACFVPEKDETFDRIICYSVWPHLDNIDNVVAEFDRLLKPRGLLHVWRLNSKEAINQIHAKVGEAVRGDMLVPAEETVAHLEKHGLEILEVVDNENRYLVTARKVEDCHSQ